MTGPEHCLEAERLLDVASSPAGAAMRVDGYDVAAQAQAHATLALVAATVATSHRHLDDAWNEAAS